MRSMHLIMKARVFSENSSRQIGKGFDIVMREFLESILTGAYVSVVMAKGTPS